MSKKYVSKELYTEVLAECFDGVPRGTKITAAALDALCELRLKDNKSREGGTKIAKKLLEESNYRTVTDTVVERVIGKEVGTHVSTDVPTDVPVAGATVSDETTS